MLQLILDRLATACGDALKHRVASTVFYALSGVESGRFGEFLDVHDNNAVAGIFHAPGWDGHILVGLDRDLLYTMVEVLFGADGSEPAAEDERAFSAIELRVAQMVFEQVGRALEAAFGLVSQTAFRLERTETRMEFAVIGRRTNNAVQAKFLFQALNRSGEMFLVIPQALLNPLRASLAKVLTGESTARDPRWSSQIAAEVQKAEVTLRAVLEEAPPHARRDRRADGRPGDRARRDARHPDQARGQRPAAVLGPRRTGAGLVRAADRRGHRPGRQGPEGQGRTPWPRWLTACCSPRWWPPAPAWCRCT